MERTGNLKAWCRSLIAFKWHSSKVLSALKWAPQFTAFVAPPVSDTWKRYEQLESKLTTQESARVEMILLGCDYISDLFILHWKILDFKMPFVAALWWRKYRGQSEVTILLYSEDVRPDTQNKALRTSSWHLATEESSRRHTYTQKTNERFFWTIQIAGCVESVCSSPFDGVAQRDQDWRKK